MNEQVDVGFGFVGVSPAVPVSVKEIDLTEPGAVGEVMRQLRQETYRFLAERGEDYVRGYKSAREHALRVVANRVYPVKTPEGLKEWYTQKQKEVRLAAAHAKPRKTKAAPKSEARSKGNGSSEPIPVAEIVGSFEAGSVGGNMPRARGYADSKTAQLYAQVSTLQPGQVMSWPVDSIEKARKLQVAVTGVMLNRRGDLEREGWKVPAGAVRFYATRTVRTAEGFAVRLKRLG